MACNTEIKRRANQKKENPQTEARIWEASRALKGNKFKNLAQAACHYGVPYEKFCPPLLWLHMILFPPQ
jgi:hypothetical protein